VLFFLADGLLGAPQYEVIAFLVLFHDAFHRASSPEKVQEGQEGGGLASLPCTSQDDYWPRFCTALQAGLNIARNRDPEKRERCRSSAFFLKLT
jgi:hypothetical protein